MTDVEIITAREVPLGGPRAMTVHRTLPQRQGTISHDDDAGDNHGV